MVVLASLVFSISARAADIDPLLELRASLAITTLKAGSGLRLQPTVRVVSEKLSTEGEFDYLETTLEQPQLGRIRLLLRGPNGFSSRNDHGLRALFLASGFFSGKEAVRLIGSDPNTVGIGFEYPVRLEDLSRDPGSALAFVQKTPLQIAAALQWIARAPWLKQDHLVAMGVSLGGIFLPVSLHLAQSLGTRVGGAIFGYTGAHLAPVAGKMLRGKVSSDVLEKSLALINNLTALHDPKLHLPFLDGRFLVIRASDDDVFPLESERLLEELLPQPKTILTIAGPHINVDKTDMIARTQTAIYQWLEQNLP